jgi:hypothetical protein
MSQNAKIYNEKDNEYYTYVNCPKKTLKGDFTASKGGLSRPSPLSLAGQLT